MNGLLSQTFQPRFLRSVIPDVLPLTPQPIHHSNSVLGEGGEQGEISMALKDGLAHQASFRLE